MGEFRLPEGKVTVKYIKKRKGMAAGEHIGEDHVISGGLFDKAIIKYTVPLLRKGGLKNILTHEEKEYLENETGLNLSVYSGFWENRQVALSKQDVVFNLSNPMDYIQVAILKANEKEIAVGWENRKKRLDYRFVIVEDGEELRADKKRFDSKKKAWKAYSIIEDERDILIGVLKLIDNKPISENSKLEWVQGKVEEYVDKHPVLFINMIQDPSFDTRLLINNAVDKGVVIKQGNKYVTVDGLELCEASELPTFENAVRYLDNPKHQDVRSIFEARLSGEKVATKKSKK